MSTLDIAVRLNGFREKFHDWMVRTPKFHVTSDTDSQDEDWVRLNFYRSWTNEFKAAGQNRAIAIDMAPGGEVAGFVAWNVPKLGFFGPLGVAEKFRGNDIGTGLTLFALSKMELLGHGWAIIHDIGPLEFYKKFLQIVELPRY